MNQIRMAGPWITEVEKQLVAQMMETGWDNYEYVERFEAGFAAWHNRKYCLMTPCCTHAIHLGMMALGISPGDEVIVPECTWTATAAPVRYLGATPVFADICPDTWCLDPSSVRRNITPKTKAIIVVDLYGNMPDMTGLLSISDEYGIPLLEDAAEALGSTYEGERAGKFGIASFHSFHRTKTMTTGEGGAVLIDDETLYERAKFLRDHGRSSTIPYYTLEATPKYMPSNIQGALACAQFSRIDELVERKRYFLHRFKANLSDIPAIQLNLENDSVFNGVWATSLVFDKSLGLDKATIIKKLEEKGVPARPFFYPLSSLPAYEAFGNDCEALNPVAYDISNRGITLASHYELTDEHLDFISQGIRELVSSC